MSKWKQSRLCFTDPNITFKDILQPNNDNGNVVGNMNQSDCTTNTSVLSITVPNILEDIQTSTSSQEDTIILTEPLTPTTGSVLDIPIVILPESTVIVTKPIKVTAKIPVQGKGKISKKEV